MIMYDAKNARNQPIVKYLKNRFNSTKKREGITIDISKCKPLILERLEEKKLENPKYLDKFECEKYFDEKLWLCLKIKIKEWYCHRSYFAYRLDSNFTNLPKKIRKILMIDGEESIEIDIKSCQPTMLWTILNKKFNDNEIYHNELQLLKEKLQSDMYEEFGKICQTNRSLGKMMFMSWIFAEVGASKYDKIRQYFIEHFPLLLKYIEEVKQRGPWFTDDDEEHEQHTLMARWLQREEVIFMIDNFAMKLLKVEPKFSFFTVHDSIIVPKSKYELVKNMLNDELKEKNIPTRAE